MCSYFEVKTKQNMLDRTETTVHSFPEKKMQGEGN